ncbi:hypothetical protein GY45DRAFT_1329112 [Cubamyces sp. BRFM 1775]|nr:hypothetical protein GY45DRAFT_1329112 [Cubamyces sp. BRFM 1775]
MAVLYQIQDWRTAFDDPDSYEAFIQLPVIPRVIRTCCLHAATYDNDRYRCDLPL